MWRCWKRRRWLGRIPSTFAKTLYSPSDKADSMSNRIGNSCNCREAYTPVHGRERLNELRAAREASREAQALGPARFSGSTAGFQSEESADLVVKTADGDTVRISIDALTKAKAGVYSASAGGANAGSQVFSGESSYSVKVRVKVKGPRRTRRPRPSAVGRGAPLPAPRRRPRTERRSTGAEGLSRGPPGRRRRCRRGRSSHQGSCTGTAGAHPRRSRRHDRRPARC